LPKEHSSSEITSFINHNIHNEVAVEEATNILKRLTEHENFNISSNENKHVLLKIMNQYANETHIISNVLYIVEKSLAIQTNENIHLGSKFLEKFFYLFLVITLHNWDIIFFSFSINFIHLEIW
jgi:hypothetical protein